MAHLICRVGSFYRLRIILPISALTAEQAIKSVGSTLKNYVIIKILTWMPIIPVAANSVENIRRILKREWAGSKQFPMQHTPRVGHLFRHPWVWIYLPQQTWWRTIALTPHLFFTQNQPITVSKQILPHRHCLPWALILANATFFQTRAGINTGLII